MFKNFFSNSQNKPDQPINFGYKNDWLAIKSSDANKVALAFGLRNIETSNWKAGLDYAYSGGVFITPPIKEWILVVGYVQKELEENETQELLKKLSKEFGECQVFMTERTVEYHAWGKATNGNIERLYAYLGERGENLIIEGKSTQIEQSYNLINTLSEEAKQDNYWERKDLYFPEEETVMEIAENWSINPTKISSYESIDGLGLTGEK